MQIIEVGENIEFYKRLTNVRFMVNQENILKNDDLRATANLCRNVSEKSCLKLREIKSQKCQYI